MKNILIHGLGQTEASWSKVENELNNSKIQVEKPNLFDLTKNYHTNYENLYKVFADYCNRFKDNELNLCGISLGGILAIDYANEYPQKVKSLVLIGVPSKVPKILFKVQNIIFKIMPKSVFEEMGCSKKDFTNFVNSMASMDILSKIKNIKCKTLIIYGEKDKVNLQSAKDLHNNIFNSEIKIIENSSHEVNIDNPKELSNVIERFYKNI